MAEGKRQYARHSEEIKAAALADLVLLGPGATAAKYDIPLGTLKTWQQQYDIVHDPSVKKAVIEALAMTYLEASLQALTAQAYVTSQPEYINRQPAGELAILHGVMADKSVRLLDALAAGDRRRARAALDADRVHSFDTD